MNTILYEKENGIVTLTINRPETLNTLNYATLEEMHHCFQRIAKDDSVRVIILTGAGDRAFVAGADISFMQTLTAIEARAFALYAHEVFRTIEHAPQPVIAAVNGFALGGGCELAMACDIRIAAATAHFGQPEVRLGVTPGFGGTQRLPRLIGKGRACELLLTGDMIGAEEAYRLGLVNKVVEGDMLRDVCRNMAERIASRGPLAVKLCKEAVQNGLEMDSDRACRYEAEIFGVCFAGDEQKEGMRAFLEKRSPDFGGGEG